MEKKLKFAKGNAKLDKEIHVFSLPAGWSCPGAKECVSKVFTTGTKLRVEDGKNIKFRCFAATQEAMYKNTYAQRRYNFELLRKTDGVVNKAKLLLSSMPESGTGIMRLHASGDFFSLEYFDAWAYVARCRPGWQFYGYTKSLPYWIARRDQIPPNLTLTASYGGQFDWAIQEYNLKHATVVFSEEEAAAMDYPIDHDDTYAMQKDTNFALLLHGVQPKGTAAARALTQLRKKGITGYNRKVNNHVHA
jgi:Gene product 88